MSMVKPPQIQSDWIHINSDAVYYGSHIVRQIYTTKIFATSSNFTPNELVNRVIKSGDHWGVIKSNSERLIEVWGDFTGETSFSLLPSYRFK